MGLFSGITNALKGAADLFTGGIGGKILDGALGFLGADQQNSANAALMRDQMAFNASEAQKNRDFQSGQRSTAYQTAIEDLKKAGLNPMLAYTQGGAANTSGAQASSGGLPQMVNKVQAGLANSATMAQINKTNAETKVQEAMADQVRADTALKTSSTRNVDMDTRRLESVIDQIKENINLQAQQGITEVAKRALMATQADLNKINTDLAGGKIGLVEAQIRLTKATARLQELEIPRSENIAGTQGSWWMRNVSPYLNDSVKATSAFKTLSDTMNLKGD